MPVTVSHEPFPRSFRTIFKKLLPWYLTRGEGEKVAYSLNLLRDEFAEATRQSLLARWPSYCTPDALPLLGRDRRIVRGLNESADSYRARLLPWLDNHRVRGNAFELLRQLRAYLNAQIRVRTVDRRGNWFTIEANGTESFLLNEGNWDWDELPASRWSRFWVIIYSTAGVPWSVRSGTWGDLVDSKTNCLGFTATVEQIATIRAIIRDWQPDGTRCEWVIVAFDGSSFDPTTPEPDGTWRLFGKQSGANRVPARLSTARYFAGVDGGIRGNPA